MMLNKLVLATAALSLAIAVSGTASAGKFKSRTVSPPPSGPTKLTGKQPTVADLYCKNNSSHHVPCDIVFKNYCKLIGGTLSGRQGWGGQTCVHRHEW